jgi:hypothetical protein
MADIKTWVITLSGSKPIHAVADQLSAFGLDLQDVLEHTGVIVGNGTAETAATLRDVPGVADVSENQPGDIGPPGAEISKIRPPRRD